MHFYDKDAPERGEWVGKRVAESAYEEEMPARFEARGVRVFLKRTEAKKVRALAAPPTGGSVCVFVTSLYPLSDHLAHTPYGRAMRPV